VDGELKLEHQLCVALNRASRAVNACYRPLLNDIGLTYSQYSVMLVLWEQESTTLGELARLLQLDSGTLSPLLKRMAEHGHLTRSRSADDERVLIVSLTPAGRALQSQAVPIQAEVETATQLGPDELSLLRDSLRDLTEELNAHLPA